MINRLIVNSDQFLSDMCRLGGKYGSDKSPLNDIKTAEIPYRHAYTSIYSLVFAPLRYRPVTMAEIGTYKGAGLKMFRDYFPNASIYGFDNSLELINHCRSINLDQTYIEYIDVNLVDEITRAFEKTGQSFDIIIDDSSHHVQHQANVIKSCFDFLKPGGMMIIEDIFNDKRAPEMVFENALEDIISELALVTFLYPDNKNIYTGSWNNEKMLLLIKN